MTNDIDDNDDDAEGVRVWTACDCEPIGLMSNDSSCSRDAGQCQCRDGITGRRCDACVDGYFGLLTPDDYGTCKRQLQLTAVTYRAIGLDKHASPCYD